MFVSFLKIYIYKKKNKPTKHKTKQKKNLEDNVCLCTQEPSIKVPGGQ